MSLLVKRIGVFLSDGDGDGEREFYLYVVSVVWCRGWFVGSWRDCLDYWNVLFCVDGVFFFLLFVLEWCLVWCCCGSWWWFFWSLFDYGCVWVNFGWFLWCWLWLGVGNCRRGGWCCLLMGCIDLWVLLCVSVFVVFCCSRMCCLL